MARKFFYVCAGLFLLTLAYQLGATSAQAQFVVDGASVWDGIPSAAVGRTLYVGVSGTRFQCQFLGQVALSPPATLTRDSYCLRTGTSSTGRARATDGSRLETSSAVPRQPCTSLGDS